jgi:hypothetical protein
MEAEYTVVSGPKQYTPELGGTQQKSPVVRLFGVTEHGNSVLINGACVCRSHALRSTLCCATVESHLLLMHCTRSFSVLRCVRVCVQRTASCLTSTWPRSTK